MRTITGSFWKADDPSTKVAGTLVIDDSEDGRRYVDLEGSFSATFREFRRVILDSHSYPLIHCDTQDGPYTLFDCTSSGTWRSDSHARESLIPEYMVKGSLIPDADSFDELRIALDHLWDWHRISGLNLSDTPVGETLWTTSYAWPQREAATLPGGEVIDLVHTYRRHHMGGQFHLDEESFLRVVTPGQLRSVPDLFSSYGWKLRNLISVLTLVPEVVTKVVVRGPRFVRSREDSESRQDLEVLGRFSQPALQIRTSGSIHPVQQLATLAEWPGGFPVVVTEWFALIDRAAEAVELYSRSESYPEPWLLSRVASLVRSLEAYHRLLELRDDEAEYRRKLVERALAPFEGSDRQWLESRLRHAHEPNLGSRLKQLVDRARDVLKPLFDNSSRRSSFIHGLTEIRNTESHPGDRTRAKLSLGFQAQYTLYLQVRWLFLANILLDMGLDGATAQRLVRLTQQFQQLMGRTGLTAPFN